MSVMENNTQFCSGCGSWLAPEVEVQVTTEGPKGTCDDCRDNIRENNSSMQSRTEGQ